MKPFSVFFIVLFSITSFAQKQAIIISSKYEFQKEKNAYNINNMLKAILVSNNYEVYFDDAVLPLEIAQNRCNALTGILVDNSNMFLTKMKFQIKDCQNNLVFETAEVKSKNKDIQTGYIEAVSLLSPELKKYKVALLPKKEVEVVEKEELLEFIELSPSNVKSSELKFSFIEVSDGFNVVCSDFKRNLHVKKTSHENIFIARRFMAIGVFIKTENKGYFEYYLDDKLVIEEFLF